jgi:hypothetical protein
VEKEEMPIYTVFSGKNGKNQKYSQRQLEKWDKTLPQQQQLA